MADLDSLTSMALSLQRHVEHSNPLVWKTNELGRMKTAEQIERDLDASDTVVILAEAGEQEPVGMAIGTVKVREEYEPGTVGMIERLFVEDRYRGRGLGRRLVNSICSFFRGRGVNRISVRYVIGNREAEGFWGCFGLKPVITVAGADLEELMERY